MGLIRGALTIRQAEQEDAGAIARLYNVYVDNSIATFETDPVTAAEMAARMVDVSEQGNPWLVAKTQGELVAYAYATAWRARAAYRFTVETSVYVAEQFTGKGVGRQLYQTLLDELKSVGIRSAIAVVSLPNPASAAVHERLGFKQAGHLQKVGRKFDRWIDVGYWQLDLQRR